MASPAKITKLPCYNHEWEEKYACIEFEGRSLCLLCRNLFGGNKKSNIERHYKRLHENSFEQNFPVGSTARKNEINVLKSRFLTRRSSAHMLNKSAEALTEVSLKITHLLAKAQKPIEDAKIIKQVMIDTADILIRDDGLKQDYLDSLQKIPLSKKTIDHQIEVLGDGISEKLAQDCEKCKWISLQLSDSANLSQLSVFVRMVFDDLSVTEELVDLFLRLVDEASILDYFYELKKFLLEHHVPLGKIVSIDTDGVSTALDFDYSLSQFFHDDPDFSSFKSYGSLQDAEKIEVVANYLLSPLTFDEDEHDALLEAIISLHPVQPATTRHELLNISRIVRMQNMLDAHENIWEYVAKENLCPNLVTVYQRTLSAFTSKHLCESTFMTMIHIKHRLKANFTDQNIIHLVKIAISSYDPDFRKLARTKQSKISN